MSVAGVELDTWADGDGDDDGDDCAGGGDDNTEDAVGDGVADGLADGDEVGVGEGDGVGLAEGDGVADADGEGVGLADGLGEAAAACSHTKFVATPGGSVLAPAWAAPRAPTDIRTPTAATGRTYAKPIQASVRRGLHFGTATHIRYTLCYAYYFLRNSLTSP
jgi:hypothetical protein